MASRIMDTKRFQQRWIRVALLSLLLSSALVMIAVITLFLMERSYDWTLQEVNEYFGAMIPPDASNLAIEGRQGLGARLVVTFDAPPASADKFARQFCDGTLYAGYDPFHAVDTDAPFTFAHLITLGMFSYYSYSLQTPATIFGNRCSPLVNRGAYLQLTLDTGKPEKTHAMLQMFFSCDACRALRPNTVRLVEDLPFWLGAVEKDGSIYRLLDREVCIGTEAYSTDTNWIWGQVVNGWTPDYSQPTSSADAARERWQELLGAEIQMEADGQPAAFATLDSDLKLVNRRDKQGQLVVGISGNELFYCFDPGIALGSYDMNLHLTTRTGVTSAYNWTLIKG